MTTTDTDLRERLRQVGALAPDATDDDIVALVRDTSIARDAEYRAVDRYRERAKQAEQDRNHWRRRVGAANDRADHYRDRLSAIDCGHGYRLTDSCPCCDACDASGDMGARLVCAANSRSFGYCQQSPGHTGDHENDHFMWGDER